jgi:UDP-glucose 4-epimerase
MAKTKRILITGGAGFIGVNLIKYLFNKTNWQIVVLDNLSASNKTNLGIIEKESGKKVKFIKGDITNASNVATAMSGCSLVVNLAAQTGVMPSLEDPLEDAKINIIGQVTLLNQAVKSKVQKFIQASSAAPLGEQSMPLHEEKIPAPLSPYGASKMSNEGYCSAFAGSFDINTVALRFTNVYGPFSGLKGSVIPLFIKLLLDKKQPFIFGDGKQTRDFVYVEDICQAIYLALTKKIKNRFELIQLGTGKETSVNQFYALLQKELQENGIKVPSVKYKPQRAGEIVKNYTRISKASRILGYKPKFTLENGLKLTVEDFLNK